MIVSFSGIDGAGKTTQIENLISYCQAHGITYSRKWSKARGTPGIMLIKRLVRKDSGMSDAEKLEYRGKVYQSGWKRKLLLQLSLLDLCWYWGVYLRAISHRYQILILDRYIWDTYVEVSSEFKIDNLSKRILWKIIKCVYVKPKVSILLNIPAEESLRRDLLKGEITTDELGLKKEKIALYDELRNKHAWNTEIDAMQSVNDTFRNVLDAVGYE